MSEAIISFKEAQQRRHDVDALRSNSIAPGGGGNDNGGMDEIARRVGVLEGKMDRVQDTLTAIQVTLARIEATMATKADVNAVEVRVARLEERSESFATKTSVSVLEERTTKLATTRSVAAMLALATSLIAIAANWSHVMAYFLGHH